MRKLLFIGLFLAYSLLGICQNSISELQRGLIFHAPLSENYPTTDLVSGSVGVGTAVYNTLDRQGSGRRYLENVNTGYASLADDARYDFGTGDFTLIASFTPANITDNGKYIISKEAGGIGYGLYQQGNDIYIRFDDNTTDRSAIIGTDVLIAGTKITCLVVFNRAGNAVLYLNGSTSSSGTVAISTANLTLDNSGAFVVGNIQAANQGFTGQIHFIRAFNFALTSQIANYSRPEYPIEWVDRGATGAELITATADRDFSSDTGWWSKDGGWTISGNKANINTGSNGAGFYRGSFLTAGSYYSISLTVSNYVSGGIKLNGSSTVFNSDGLKNIRYSPAGTTLQIESVTTANMSFDDISVKRAGCVLDLNAEGINRQNISTVSASYWWDATNNITATVSGASVMIPSASNLGATFFNGSTSKVAFTGMNGLTGDITISFNIRKILTSSYSDIFVSSGLYIFSQSSDYLAFTRSGGSPIYSAISAILINTNYNITITSTAAGITNMYINNVRSGAANQNGNTPVSGTTWIIGQYGNDSEQFMGNISKMLIWNRILSSDEINFLNDTK